MKHVLFFLLLSIAAAAQQGPAPRPNATGVVVGRTVLPFEVAYYSKDEKGYTLPVYSPGGYVLLIRTPAGDTVRLPVPFEYYNTKLGKAVRFYNPKQAPK